MSLLRRTHLSAHEIASLALDGLPESKRGVQLLAGREGWTWISRTGPGGGRLYAVADLPMSAQRDLIDRWVDIPSNRPRRSKGRPRGSDYFTRQPEIAAAVESLLADRVIAAPRVYELLSTSFPDLPSPRTLQRFIARLEAENPALFASTRDPDLYKGKYRLALGRADAAVTHANQIWEIDTTKADVLCKEGRKSILGIVDVWSRRTFYLVVDSESAQSVRRTLTAAITAWGVVPEILRTDQGSGYVNQTIATAAPLIGIDHVPVPPASGDKKPFVERMFGTFTRERAALLAGFAGHSVAQAQKLRAAARQRTGRQVIVPEMTAAELQAVIDNWLDGVYHQRVHSGTGAAPIARFMASPVASRLAPDAEALKLALSAYAGQARVTKRGVRWKNGRYWAAPLAAWMGRDVMLRRDEDDLGALFVFSPDGDYIATAVDWARSGLSEERFATEARRLQAEHMAAQRADLRGKMRSFKFEDARDSLLRRDAEAAGKLHVLPPRTTEHTTRMLGSIADVAPEMPSAAALEDAGRRLAATKPAPQLAIKSFGERVAEADALIAADAAGNPVDPAALRSARIFTGSNEYIAHKILAGDFSARTRRPIAPPITKQENRQ